jgi:hypothetical protein
VLDAAVTRKTHGNGAGDLEIDIFAGHTEPRSLEVPQPSGPLRIVATFDRDVAALGLGGGDVTTTIGTVDSILVTAAAV